MRYLRLACEFLSPDHRHFPVFTWNYITQFELQIRVYVPSFIKIWLPEAVSNPQLVFWAWAKNLC